MFGGCVLLCFPCGRRGEVLSEDVVATMDANARAFTFVFSPSGV